MFYMDVRYEGGTHGVTGVAEPNLILTDNASLITQSSGNASVAYMGLLATLLQWHAADPVDDRERLRNETVFNYQGNRNPFVDHPEWVSCLFQNVCQ
jgi:endonuclease I